MKGTPIQSHIFWGAHAPLSTLTGAGLMVVATSHLAFALTLTGALIWVNVLTVVIVSFGKTLLPKKGRELLCVFLACFSGSLYLLLIFFASPFLAMEITFLITLIPLYSTGSGICRRVEGLENEDAILKAFLEALVFGGILIALALIREPLGSGSLSLPGGSQGMVVLGVGGTGAYFPVHIIANASGGLLLLGYGLALFRRRKARSGGEDEQ